MSVQVRPATPDRWSDLVTVFGRRGKDPSWCWCRLFLRPATCEASEPADNRDALRREITHAALPPGSWLMPAIILSDGQGSGPDLTFLA